MSSITIYKEDNGGSTVIPNYFIDKYMIDANDAQIKVYLYLIRMMSANLPTSISDMADKFNHTEKDILRALRYWEKCHLLSLDFDDQKALCGIRFVTPKSESYEESARPLAPIVPLKLLSNESEAASQPKDSSAKAPALAAPEAPSYSREQLRQFKESPETSQVLFLAETYLQKNLSLSDIEILCFIHHELGFTVDLTDYLLQHCVERGKKSFQYIKKVALDWAEAGISTPKQAKSYVGTNVDKNIYTIMKYLGRSGNPTSKEIELIGKWYKEYGFSMDVIQVACERTVIATDSHRLEYCDKILSSWKKLDVKTVNDIALADSGFAARKGAKAQPKNTFNQFQGRSDYDFAELEKSILSN